MSRQVQEREKKEGELREENGLVHQEVVPVYFRGSTSPHDQVSTVSQANLAAARAEYE